MSRWACNTRFWCFVLGGFLVFRLPLFLSSLRHAKSRCLSCAFSGRFEEVFLALLNSRLGFTTFLPDDQQELHVVHVVAVKWLQNTVHAYSQQTAYIWPNGSAHINPAVATGHIITQVLLALYAHMYAVITACSSVKTMMGIYCLSFLKKNCNGNLLHLVTQHESNIITEVNLW